MIESEDVEVTPRTKGTGQRNVAVAFSAITDAGIFWGQVTAC